jgi:hypothetical protein
MNARRSYFNPDQILVGTGDVGTERDKIAHLRTLADTLETELNNPRSSGHTPEHLAAARARVEHWRSEAKKAEQHLKTVLALDAAPKYDTVPPMRPEVV